MARFTQLALIEHQQRTQNLGLLAESLEISVVHRTLPELIDNPPEQETMVAYSLGSEQLSRSNITNEIAALTNTYPLFLVNAKKDSILPNQALNLGARGLIYENDHLDRVLTAIKVISQGELYYPRSLLSGKIEEMMLRRQAGDDSFTTASLINSLTPQELKIIELVATGARNKEIAEKLNISAHTVKTHLSSIFRKTGARNRVELLKWSSYATSV
ncbi:response regulator transcription factor [Idiomarina sp. HP20-50]|uniref:response regulator transcription factor n=1 Tax=Idiomarina sp. HP20-50 TaxID=3070813 RepID=UPI00294AF098|nr:response regulator transcription factor [Idiomarina sp. HP20-50]MDV6316376.1 response regulator transcription factor [Idiomarina sp. HP20-50]